ncbi:MAG: DUF3783 domain-containing protein [Ruminococcus sp.]|nr:DUF3783 domain-containing protein [Ruminococcus sp.]
MAEILLFNIPDSKGIKIKNICRKLFIGARDVDKSDFGCRMKTILGLSDEGAVDLNADFDGEMLYLVDIGGMLDILLSQLRRNKVTVALKAMKTDSNLEFTAAELYRELSAEREAIAKGMTAHDS